MKHKKLVANIVLLFFSVILLGLPIVTCFFIKCATPNEIETLIELADSEKVAWLIENANYIADVYLLLIVLIMIGFALINYRPDRKTV